MAYKSKGPSMKQGGTFMSKHNSSYMHKQNLLDDMPVDDHASGPLKQTEVTVHDDRKNKQGQTQSEILNAAADKVNKAIGQHNKTQFTSQERVDASKRIIDDLKKNYTTKVDSINTANSKMNKLINEMNKGNYPGSLQK
jgi:seryl-tRNA synthetase